MGKSCKQVTRSVDSGVRLVQHVTRVLFTLPDAQEQRPGLSDAIFRVLENMGM
jgi:hypothetical protein